MLDQETLNQVNSLPAMMASWEELRLLTSNFCYSSPTGMGGFGPHMTSKIGFMACMHPLLKHPEIFRENGQRPVFFDMGCGIGLPLVVAAQAGWQAIGVEVEAEYCQVTRFNTAAALERGEIAPDNQPIVLHGNFFPDSFRIQRFATDEERDPRAVQGLTHAVDSAQRIDYQTLGINLGDVDIFYHFQWENLDNLLNFFSAVAKPGALFCLCGDGRDINYRITPSDIRYLMEKDWANFHIYQKI